MINIILESQPKSWFYSQLNVNPHESAYNTTDYVVTRNNVPSVDVHPARAFMFEVA